MCVSPDTVDPHTDVVIKATEWPTHDYSIKTLAKYLGFGWRDTNPSGAASIEWFNRWRREGDPEVGLYIGEGSRRRGPGFAQSQINNLAGSDSSRWGSFLDQYSQSMARCAGQEIIVGLFWGHGKSHV